MAERAQVIGSLEDRLAEAERLRVEAEWDRLAMVLTDHVPPEGWAERAACRGIHGVWVLEGRGCRYGQAQAICESCPVRLSCLTVNLNEEAGYWAVSASERERLRAAVSRIKSYSQPEDLEAV